CDPCPLHDALPILSYHKTNGVFAAWIESVTLDGSFDAKMHQVPRWGVFGKFENHLQLGIPLLAALTIAELKAILAHEVGHLGGEHDRFVAWLYRQRVAWALVQQKLAQPTNAIDRVLGKFYGWYAAYFQAYAFVLARELEYKADRAASRATHPGAVANALTKSALMGRFLVEELWARIMILVEVATEPPYPPHSMKQ